MLMTVGPAFAYTILDKLRLVNVKLTHISPKVKGTGFSSPIAQIYYTNLLYKSVMNAHFQEHAHPYMPVKATINYGKLADKYKQSVKGSQHLGIP